MNKLLLNIKELVQVEDHSLKYKSGLEMKRLNTIKDAFLLISDHKIVDYGEMGDLDKTHFDDDILMEIDCSGRLVFPSYCDSHTHIVYPGSREAEFVDKIKGLSYEEIAKRGGGILNSAMLLHETSEDELYKQALERVFEIIKLGTGAVEIKSGYGLNTVDELKILRVIKRLKETTQLTIKSTFLGAHSIPLNYKNNPSKYVDLVINEMIPQVVEEGLADYIDVFCDIGFFTPEQTDQILKAGTKFGLIGKIHANELGFSGGVQTGVKNKALSVDHLEFIGDQEIESLLNSETMPTVLPGAAFFLGMQLSPVRKMIDAGLPIALASDFNPGSSPSGNMNFIASLGCINYKMLPEEVINATTINSAYAMGVHDMLGSITKGKLANLFITKEIPGYSYLPYMFGSNLIDTVILNGDIQAF